MVAFGVGKPGPWVGKVLEDVVEWQLDNPSRSKEDCINWLRSRGVDRYKTDDNVEQVYKCLRRK